MKKIRALPFGYTIEDGVIVVHKQEAPLVHLVFEEYKGGASLNTIASMLNKTDVPYSEGAPAWNKSHVKRILDNPKYIGEEDYPILLSASDYNYVRQLKSEKNNRKGAPPLSADIALLKKRIYCSNCGSQYTRRQNGGISERWICRSKECQCSIPLTDSMIKKTGTFLLNYIIANPDALRAPSNVSASTALIKMRNDFRRELSATEINSEHAKSLLFDIAVEEYRICRENGPTATNMLRSIFEAAEPSSCFDTELFRKTVDKLWIDIDGSISLQLSNRQILSNSLVNTGEFSA